jgi:DNA-binding NarL/FixJ family response regulator
MLVLCCNDDALIEHWRAGLQGSLEQYVSCESLDNLVSLSQVGPDDLVLLDLEVIGGRAQRAASFIAAHPEYRIFVFSALHEPGEGELLVSSGARGYANRYIHPDVMSQAIQLVIAGEVWLGADLVLHLIRANARKEPKKPKINGVNVPALIAGLTPRERDITELVVAGNNNKTIASALDVTERTVKAHLGSVFKKTNTKDRLQLAVLLKDGF